MSPAARQALHDCKFVQLNHPAYSPDLVPSTYGGLVDEWLACWTQVQKGPGSNRSRDADG